MTQNKVITERDKAVSSLQKQLNRIRKKCLMYQEANDLKKLQIQQFNKLLIKLYSEDRITVAEIREFTVRKKVAKQTLNKKGHEGS